ncbi:hypothetical protein Tco_0930271 [Tanacetum coccineum]
MTCSLSHNIDEIQALVYKLMDEDKARQKVILELAVQFDNACTAKDDLRKAYEKCNDISQETVGPVTATHQGEIHVVLGLILTLFNRAACSWTAGVIWFAGLDVTPLGSNQLEVSREGYLEVAAELNCKDNVYSHCLRVNTYFALAIVEYFSGADVAILMA